MAVITKWLDAPQMPSDSDEDIDFFRRWQDFAARQVAARGASPLDLAAQALRMPHRMPRHSLVQACLALSLGLLQAAVIEEAIEA